MGLQKLQKKAENGKPQVHARRLKAEEDRNYELITRKRAEKGTFCKAFLRFLFSQVGLVLLCIAIGVGGTVKSLLD